MIRKIVCFALVLVLSTGVLSAQAATLKRAWMEYEDYSGNRAEQSVTDEKTLQELSKILLRAKGNRAKLDGCTVNCTLFCMTESGRIVDFACATDGCPYIQNRANGDTCNLGVDYQRFWEIFSKIRDGMGLEASAVFNW
ncbi:MAG: hypothetical protein IKE76_10985 [Clostridia bacterium]|nr:hypothetical protein [Clostridia bacterium]